MGTKIFKEKNLFWAGILLAQFVFFYAISYSKTAVAFAELFFEKQKTLHQSIFSSLKFSAGDFFYVSLFAVLLYQAIQIFNPEKRWFAVHTLLMISNILIFIYQIFWGLLYFEKPLISRLPHNKKAIPIEALTVYFLQKCCLERQQVHEDQNGIFRIEDVISLKSAILSAQKNLPASIFTKNSTKIISIKPSIFGKIMSYTGITGYYNPFTAEAQYDENIPDSDLPFTLAHEAAHQMGYAREEEASFAGWLSLSLSGNPALQYSADYYALKSLLAAQAEKNPDFVKYILTKYSPGMLRDREQEKRFAKAHEGPADEFFALTNDLFLKSNRQDGAVNYSYFVELLLRYENKRTAP